MRATSVLLAMTLWVCSVHAHAQAPASFAEVLEVARDKNIDLKLDKLSAAIEGSTFPWTFEMVYQLVDLGIPPEVCRSAAGKAGMFWDNPRPMSTLIEEGRASAPSQTIRIGANQDLVMVFEFFNEVKWGMEAARDAVGDLAPRQSHEDDNTYWLRKRKHQEALASATAPWEGKVDKTTFTATLTGTFTPHDGSCTRALISVDLNHVSFDVFRQTLGGNRVDVPVTVTGSNVGSVQFVASGGRRFEALGKPVCVSASTAAALTAAGSQLEITMQRPSDSDLWTGTATLKNLKTGIRL